MTDNTTQITAEYAPPPDIPTVTVENGINTYNNRVTDTKEKLINAVLTELGYPLVTVELTPEQFDVCISNACQLYTKYATQVERYLCIDFYDYDDEHGLDLKRFNIAAIKDINFVPPIALGMSTSELAFGMSGYISRMSTWRSFDFVSIQAMHEFRALAERILYPKPDWSFDNISGKLILYPNPKKLMHGGRHLYMINMQGRHQLPAVATVEIEPPLEELYSNDTVRHLVRGYAKMILAEVRGKFTGISLPGGGQINAEALRAEGQQIVNNAIEFLQNHESYNSMFVIA